MSCCGCSGIPPRVTNLYRHEELMRKFTDLTGICISANTFICDSCVAKLESSYAFKESCLQIRESLLIQETKNVLELIKDDALDDEFLIYENEEYIHDDSGEEFELHDGDNGKSDMQCDPFTINVQANDIRNAPKVKHRNTYSTEEKIEAVKYAENTTNRQAAKVLSIDESCIRKWRQRLLPTSQKYSDEKTSELTFNKYLSLLHQTSSTEEVSTQQEVKIVKSRKSYSSGQKLEVVNYAEVTGNRQAAKVFSIDESCIRKWRLNKELLIDIHRERGTKRKPNLHWPLLDKELKTWVMLQMESGIRLKPSEIKAKSIQLSEELNLINYKGTSSYIFKFMQRYNLPGRKKKK